MGSTPIGDAMKNAIKTGIVVLWSFIFVVIVLFIWMVGFSPETFWQRIFSYALMMPVVIVVVIGCVFGAAYTHDEVFKYLVKRAKRRKL